MDFNSISKILKEIKSKKISILELNKIFVNRIKENNELSRESLRTLIENNFAFIQKKVDLFQDLKSLFKESLSTISFLGSGFNSAKDKSSNSSRMVFIPILSDNGA